MSGTLVQFQNLISSNPLLFWALLVWALAWKGVALFKSARNGQKVWFVALLIVNTLGVLEIIYLICCGKKKEPQALPPTAPPQITTRNLYEK